MTYWKNLFKDPPHGDCNICIKVGDNFETYFFKRYSHTGWEIYKQLRPIEPSRIPAGAVYINLDEIK